MTYRATDELQNTVNLDTAVDELEYLSEANSNIQQQITAALIAAYSTRALTTAEIDEILAQ